MSEFSRAILPLKGFMDFGSLACRLYKNHQSDPRVVKLKVAKANAAAVIGEARFIIEHERKIAKVQHGVDKPMDYSKLWRSLANCSVYGGLTAYIPPQEAANPKLVAPRLRPVNVGPLVEQTLEPQESSSAAAWAWEFKQQMLDQGSIIAVQSMPTVEQL